MARHVPLDRAGAIPLRRGRSACTLLWSDAAVPATIDGVTGAGATLETSARPPIGAIVGLRHPHGGTIAAEIAAHGGGGLRLAFARDEQALGFALAVLLGSGT